MNRTAHQREIVCTADSPAFNSSDLTWRQRNRP
jgi:hypothetical protein